MIVTLFNSPEFNWVDFPLSPIPLNNDDVNNEYDVTDLTNTDDIIDLTNTEDDEEMIDIENYVFDSGEIWNPTVKKIKKNKKIVKNKKSESLL